MKRFVLFLSSAIFALTVFAQNATYVWGPELNQKIPGKYWPNIIGNKDNIIYGYRGNIKDGLWLEKYNEQDLGISLQNLIMDETMVKSGTSESFEDAYMVDDRIITFFSVSDKQKSGQKEFTMVARVYDLELNLINEKELVSALGGKVYNPFMNIRFSPDKSKFAVYSMPDSRTPSKITVNVFNTKFEKIDSKDLDLGFQHHDNYTLKTQVDNEGNAYILFTDETVKVRVGLNDDTYFYTHTLYISKVGGINRDIIRYEPKTAKSGKQIINFTYRITAKNEISFLGLYTSPSKKGVNGVFLMKYDIGQKTPKFSEISEFEKSFLDVFLKGKFDDKGSKPPYYNLDQSIFKPDGSIILIAEERTTFTHHSSNTSTYSRNFTYGDLLVSNLDNNARILNSSYIFKFTESPISYLTLFTVAESNGAVHFIYQRCSSEFKDGILKTPNQAPNQASYCTKMGIVAMYTSIKPDGQTHNEILFDCEKELTAMYFDYYKQLNNNTLLIMAKTKFWKLGKLTF